MALTADELAQVEANTNNSGLNSLRIAIGDSLSVYEMVDGFGDVYTDETGVNTGSSIAQVYDGTNDYYESHGGPVDTGTDFYDASTNGATITANGNAQTHIPTGSGGDTDPYGGTEPVISFDGVSGSYLSAPDSALWRLDPRVAGSGFKISAWIKPANVTGIKAIISQINSTSTNRCFELYLNGATPSFLYYVTAGVGESFSSSITVSANVWSYIEVIGSNDQIEIFVNGNSGGTRAETGQFFDSTNVLEIGSGQNGVSDLFNGYISEPRIFNTAPASDYQTDSKPTVSTEAFYLDHGTGPANMTLIGNAQTANSQPTHVRAVVLYDPVDAATLNTDAILSISRDGGTTYTQATLTKEAEYGTVDSGVVEILTTGEVDISAQPSGTSIVYKFETLNSKNIRIHGIDVKWR